jgi:hypothetical protein
MHSRIDPASKHQMKTLSSICLVIVVMGCNLQRDPSSLAFSKGHRSPAVESEDDASVPEDAALPPDEEVPPALDAATPVAPQEPWLIVPGSFVTPDAGVLDAATPEADAATDARVDDESDAGTDDPDGQPTVEVGAPNTGATRSLHVHLTGMDDDLNRFSQFRVVTTAGQFFVMFVIHEGIPTADYEFNLPAALFVDQAYRLDFFIDHNNSGGYNAPPADHAWSIPIPAGAGDVSLEVPYNTHFTDIEQIAPSMVRSLILSSSNMYHYVHELFDVRVIDRAAGRLAGRQVREVPGDSFDLTVGAVVQPGVEYEVDVSLDLDKSGDYTPGDLGWRIISTATPTGLHLPFSADADPVDLSQ